jgi:hypothetical protein
MRFRLRYQQHDYELAEGQFAIGRNSSCQLAIDDPLVSRRHAILTVQQDRLFLEDLQSRNGVLVNGRRISGSVEVKAGDRVMIGAQELTLHSSRERDTPAAHPSQAGNRTLPRVVIAQPSDDPGSETDEFEPSMIRRSDSLVLLGSIAEKALAMGRADEAERILASALADVIEASRAGKKVTTSLCDMAARFSARLATATGKGAWADYVIELYTAQGRPAPAPVIDELYHALRKVNAVDLRKLREYIAQMRERSHAFGPADRFLVQRIEGLERLAAAR